MRKFIKVSMLLLQTVVMWVVFGVCRGTIGEPCKRQTAGYVWHEPDKNGGDRRCCRQIECPAGQHPVSCTTEVTTRCKACREGRYSESAIKSGPFFDCHEKITCPSGMEEVDIKSRTHNTICTCGIGKEKNSYGDGCNTCTDGFFKSEVGDGSCRKWTTCEDSPMIKEGTASSDRECKSEGELTTRKPKNSSSINTSTPFIQTSSALEDTTLSLVTVNPIQSSSTEAEQDDGPGATIIACSVIGGAIVVIAVIIFVIYKRMNIKANGKYDHDTEAIKGPSSDIRTISGTIVHSSEYGSKPQSINALRPESTRSQEYSENRDSCASGSDTSSQNPNDDSGIGDSSNNLNQKSNTRTRAISSSSKPHNISIDEKSLLSTDWNYTDMKLTGGTTMQKNKISVPVNPDTLLRNGDENTQLPEAGCSDYIVNRSHEDLIGQKILLAAPDMERGPLAQIEREAADVIASQSALLANIQRQNSAEGCNHAAQTLKTDKALKPDYGAGIEEAHTVRPSLKMKQRGCVTEKDDEEKIKTPIPCTGDNENLQLSKSPYFFDKPLPVSRNDVISSIPDPSNIFGVQIFIGDSHFKGSNIQIS